MSAVEDTRRSLMVPGVSYPTPVEDGSDILSLAVLGGFALGIDLVGRVAERLADLV